MKKLRVFVNIGMIIVLQCLMAYSLIGERAHEILGTIMFGLLALHHILNRRWFGAIRKGRYRTFRILQTALVFWLIFSVLASAISGIILSKHLYAFLHINAGTAFARSIHLVCAYLNDILMSLHLGLHWNVMISAMERKKEGKFGKKVWIHRGIAIAIALYGICAFIKRRVGAYLFLQTQFVFFDTNEPLIFFFIDYIAIMSLFIFCGHYLAKLLKRCQ